MRRWWGMGMIAAMMLASAARAEAPAAGSAAGGPAPVSVAQKLKVKKLTLGIRHRAHADFYDQRDVRMGEEFQVGDTEYSARVLQFVADFDIDLKTRKVTSRSNRPDNPAFQIVAIEKGAPHDTSWAFLNFPPHFSKRSLLAFQVLRIEFENHAPVVPKAAAPDTAAGASR